MVQPSPTASLPSENPPYPPPLTPREDDFKGLSYEVSFKNVDEN